MLKRRIFSRQLIQISTNLNDTHAFLNWYWTHLRTDCEIGVLRQPKFFTIICQHLNCGSASRKYENGKLGDSTHFHKWTLHVCLGSPIEFWAERWRVGWWFWRCFDFRRNRWFSGSNIQKCDLFVLLSAKNTFWLVSWKAYLLELSLEKANHNEFEEVNQSDCLKFLLNFPRASHHQSPNCTDHK